MSSSNHLISEFIQALQQEIETLRKRRGGNSVRLLNGRLLRETGGLWVYHFQLESILSALDDTPGEIEIDGRQYKCQIISVKGLEVHLALEKNFGPQIPEAVIQTNLWFLLELLCKKYDEARSNADTLFKTSRSLFAGKSQAVAGGETDYELYPDPPNQSQRDAIEASFNKSLAVIWDPPGTGKTKTIAKAVEAHLNAGRRVLLVSHANTAVDEALEKIAHQLQETPFYLEGQLIRLGTPYKVTLEESYPLVKLENIAAMLGESLVKKKSVLVSERSGIEGILAVYKELSSEQAEIQSQSGRKEDLNKSLLEKDKRVRELDESMFRLGSERHQNKAKLAKARESGSIKRFFTGLDPDRIQREIDRQTAALESRQQEKSELEQSRRQTETAVKAIEEKVTQLTGELSALYYKHGLKPEQLDAEKETREKRLDELNSQISDIDKALGEIQKKALDNARLVATTLTKTFSSKEFADKPFDVLIVDESSMAPLPYLFWAAGKVKTSVTVVGDFKQLPPICSSDEPLAKKWLGRSIFDELNIATVQDAVNDDRVSLLNIQYRMYPAIADVSNRLFYENRLGHDEGTRELVLNDSLSGTHPLVLINTEGVNPWGSQLTYGGRFNLYHAFTVATLSRDLLDLYAGSEQVDRIGVITPYGAQARLIGKIAEDMGIRDRLRVNTVHTFQGGEESIIILDTVEGIGNKRWSMLDDKNSNGHEARLLTNVAITRARYKLFVVGNKKYIRENYRHDSVICRIIDIFNEQGYVIPSEKIDDSFLVDNFDKWSAALAEPVAFMNNLDSTIYSEKNFWPAFTADLLSAQKSVMIMSPFITLKRTGKLQSCFQALLNKSVEVKIFTRPPKEQGDNLEDQAGQVINHMQRLGVKVIQLNGMHQKIAVTDRKITWEGSLNILSHYTSREHMRRFEGPKTAEQIITNYHLDKDNPPGAQRDDLCPDCARKGIEINLKARQGRYGPFLGCPNYPACWYTRDLKVNSRRRSGKTI